MPTFEEKWAALNDSQRENLAKAGLRLFDNPDVSPKAKELLMKADPSVRFPEVLQANELTRIREENAENLRKLEQSQLEERAERNREKRWAEARDAGVDPEEVEKVIVEKGIAKWDAAVEFVQMRQRTATPTPAAYDTSRNFELPDGKNDWFKDPTKKARAEAHKAIDELRGRTAPARAHA